MDGRLRFRRRNFHAFFSSLRESNGDGRLWIGDVLAAAAAFELPFLHRLHFCFNHLSSGGRVFASGFLRRTVILRRSCFGRYAILLARQMSGSQASVAGPVSS